MRTWLLLFIPTVVDCFLMPSIDINTYGIATFKRLKRSTEVKAARNVRIDGDIMIGGLFPLHEANSIPWQNQSTPNKCGKIKADQGVQRLQTMLFAVDRINNDPLVLNGLKLGVHILDTCSQDTYALEQTLEFIKAAISTNSADQYVCEDGSAPVHHTKKPIAAVIGAASSQVSVMVASMLTLFKVRKLLFLVERKTSLILPCFLVRRR